MAFGLPPVSFIGYPVAIPCAGHAGLGFRAARRGDETLILAHLEGLSPEDRHLRFCATLGDAALERHVAELWDRASFALAAHDGPLWAGPFHRAGPVRGFAELAIEGTSAELGISVDAERRGAGVGTYLVQTAARLLAQRGIGEIVAVTVPRNVAMIRLGQSSGARVEHGGGDVVVTFAVDRLHRAYLARRAAQVFAPCPRVA